MPAIRLMFAGGVPPPPCPTRGRHMASTWSGASSARCQHMPPRVVRTRSAHVQHVVGTRSAHVQHARTSSAMPSQRSFFVWYLRRADPFNASEWWARWCSLLRRHTPAPTCGPLHVKSVAELHIKNKPATCLVNGRPPRLYQGNRDMPLVLGRAHETNGGMPVCHGCTHMLRAAPPWRWTLPRHWPSSSSVKLTMTCLLPTPCNNRERGSSLGPSLVWLGVLQAPRPRTPQWAVGRVGSRSQQRVHNTQRGLAAGDVGLLRNRDDHHLPAGDELLGALLQAPVGGTAQECKSVRV